MEEGHNQTNTNEHDENHENIENKKSFVDIEESN
jgi:hypothetical protein